jgi:nucleotide-binding universal stress UspA family protein
MLGDVLMEDKQDDRRALRPDATIATSNVQRYRSVTERPLKFLVCVDARPESEVALRLACIKAAKRNGYVDILHVMEPPEAQTLLHVSEKIREEQIENAQILLNRLAQKAEEITSKTPNLLLREGPIGETIVKVAQENNGVNMLVLGVAKSGTSRGQLVAWLSTQLGEKLMMPMMLIPGNLNDEQMIEIS